MSDLYSKSRKTAHIFVFPCCKVQLLSYLMKRTLLFLIWLLVICYSSFSQSSPTTTTGAKITIQLDFESAKAITRLLTKTTTTDTELNQVAKLYGNQQLIDKVTSYDKTGTEVVFKQTLRELIETGTIKGNDPFDWRAAKSNVVAVQHLISEIEAKGSFPDDVKSCILPYCPPTSQITARACFLVGGGALGFTIGHDATFNVALQKIVDDYEGLVYLVAHELYHTIQQVGQRSRKKEPLVGDPPKHVANTYMLLTNLWSEGTATLVGDFTTIKKPKSLATQQQNEYQRNRQRSRQNFVLFESLLYSAYHDSTANPNQLYNIGFTVAFDQTAYYTGYRMAKEIEEHKGKAVLAALITQSPIEFCRVYIQLYQEHPDKINIKFSSATEAIIAKMQPWINKIWCTS